MSAPPASSAGHTETHAGRAIAIVRVLAEEPRPAGSEAEARARAYCAERLRGAGFDVREEPFEYSSFVGRWGTPLGGAIALAILLGGALAGRAGRPAVSLAILTLGAIVLGGAASTLARTGVLRFPAERRRGVNLVATRRRDDAAPTLWLMAHLDSKSQPVPILVRAAGITLLTIVWLVGIAASAIEAAAGRGGLPHLWATIGVVAVIAALPVIATTVSSHSPGALDNATGVATVLAAAERAQSADVGVCLTSAEELGLAGARSWVSGATGNRPAVAINCDGIDDGGRITCMYSGRRPDALVASLASASSRLGLVMRAHRLLPGVLTDGVALADAGWQVVTLSRGGARTLARIHTTRDRADLLSGVGMDEVARLIVELVDVRT